VVKAFNDAMAAQGDYDAMEALWTRAVEVSPPGSAAAAAALTNRGSARLQGGRWRDAYSDLKRAVDLELEMAAAQNGGGDNNDGPYGGVSALLLNQLGNAEGALGKWDDAIEHYEAAAADGEMESIARANLALAAFETGDAKRAAREARALLRRDPQFLDARAALVAFLWADGEPAAAEGEWEALQASGGGLGAALYSRATARERVAGRWPPRASAALDAFLRLAATGTARDYDGPRQEYGFDRAVGSASS
jgi:tetratricopeptide (TPR) repeat protein